MKIMNKLTISNLKLNKKRTIVTIIGIILSVALITSLSTLISSFRSSLYNFYIQQRGNYHYAFYDINDDDYKNLSIHLISGKMPENSDEIVIAKHLKSNGEVDLKIGDTK